MSGLVLGGAVVILVVMTYIVDHKEDREARATIVSLTVTALAVWLTYEAFQNVMQPTPSYYALLIFNIALATTALRLLAYIGRRAVNRQLAKNPR